MSVPVGLRVSGRSALPEPVCPPAELLPRRRVPHSSRIRSRVQVNDDVCGLCISRSTVLVYKVLQRTQSRNHKIYYFYNFTVNATTSSAYNGSLSLSLHITYYTDMQNSRDKELTQKAHEMRDFQNKTGSNRTQAQKQRPKHFVGGLFKEKRS